MNALFDIIPSKYRRLVYAIVTLAAFIYGLWQAFDGDWSQVIGAVVTAATTAMATANTQPVGKEAVPIVEDPEDDANAPVDETVADVVSPDYPEHDESADDAEYPNAETLYQPGEKEGERFGYQTDTGSVSGNGGNSQPMTDPYGQAGDTATNLGLGHPGDDRN